LKSGKTNMALNKKQEKNLESACYNNLLHGRPESLANFANMLIRIMIKLLAKITACIAAVPASDRGHYQGAI
jgi:hypothetical protein